MSAHIQCDPPTVLTQPQVCAARYWGADAALTMAPDTDGAMVPAAPQLSTRCDAELSIHTLVLDVVPKSVLVKLSPADVSAVHAELVAAWEEGRDVVWEAAVRATRLRRAGNVVEASAIEQVNERYVDSLRSSMAEPNPDALW